MKLMTPGPTMVAKNVRMARSKETTNPDIDLEFYETYRNICNDLNRMLFSKGEVYILGGEGILSLEAACASLTEPGDDVLIIDNGIFGKGFADFVSLYGGNPILYTTDYRKPIDVNLLENYLKTNHQFKYATIVHCDTPSGVLNDIKQICPILKKYEILTVVDGVASMFGDEIRVSDWDIDILCGGSQKALSAPPGLAFVTVSEDAMKMMKERKTKIASFYCNLLTFEHYYRDKWFPYTMPISDIYGLEAAVNNVKQDKEMLTHHGNIAKATRYAIESVGLTLYLKDGYASTVTAITVPKGMKDTDILKIMRDKYSIMISGSFDVLEGKVIRIGHMGNNATVDNVAQTLEALTKTILELGGTISDNMKELFLEAVNGGI